MFDLSGQSLGQYSLIRPIGHGGMATVYLAQQPSVNREVAVKVLALELVGDEEFSARFRREAQMIARLEHPHIVPVIDFGEQGSYVYLVMRLMTGGTLKHLLEAGPLSLNRANRLLTQVARGLTHAHNQGVIHRDLKPDNVLLDGEGNAYLTDFGIAKMLAGATQKTRTGHVMGTPAYMAPEQWRSQAVDARTDVYALGMILYEMLVGLQAFEADTAYAMMYDHLDKLPPSPIRYLPDLPPRAVAVIFKAIAKPPEGRFASAQELADAFTEAVQRARHPDHQPARPAKRLPAVEPGAEETFEFSTYELPRVRPEELPDWARHLPGAPLPTGPQDVPPPPVVAPPTERTQPRRDPQSVVLPAVMPSATRRRGRGGLGVLAAFLVLGIAAAIVVALLATRQDDKETPAATRAAAHPTDVLPTTTIPATETLPPAESSGAIIVIKSPTGVPTETAVPTLTPLPTETPTVAPSATPTAQPSDTAAAPPTETLDFGATANAIVELRFTQTAEARPSATALPSSTPTPEPSTTPTPEPSTTPTLPPSDTPPLSPTEAPVFTATLPPTLTPPGVQASPTFPPTPTAADAAPAADTCYASPIGTMAVNIRSGPGTRFAVMDRLLPGELRPVLLHSASGFVYVESGWLDDMLITLSPADVCNGQPRIAAGSAAQSVCTIQAAAEYTDLRVAPDPAAGRAYLEPGGTQLHVFRVVTGIDGGRWYYAATTDPDWHFGWVPAAQSSEVTPCPPPESDQPAIPTPTSVAAATRAAPLECDLTPRGTSPLNIRSGPGVGFAVVGQLQPGTRAPVLLHTTTGYAYVLTGWVDEAYVTWTPDESCAGLPLIAPQDSSSGALCLVRVEADPGDMRTDPAPAADRAYLVRVGTTVSVFRVVSGGDGQPWYYGVTNDAQWRFGWMPAAQTLPLTGCPPPEG